MSEVVKKGLGVSVLEASRTRLLNLYSSGVKVYLSISGGKDSIVLMSLVYDLARRGDISLRNTEVVFIDEEAMFDCVIEIVAKWRKRFMRLGATFSWYCLEVRHYNCLNSLSEDESFVCWDRRKKDVWVRDMPPFAITSHPMFKPRKDTYQAFLERTSKDGVTITGVRMAESVQRRSYLATVMTSSETTSLKQFPIFDWNDKDVFKYILDRGLEIPEVYQFMWETGTSTGRLRISQFFSIDTAKALVNLYEYYPDLAERVQRREPNAYLVRLYWDTEMFRRSTKRRKETEGDRDYKAIVLKLLSDINDNFATEPERELAMRYKRAIGSISGEMTDRMWRIAYNALMAGDPKGRTLRSLYMQRNKK